MFIVAAPGAAPFTCPFCMAFGDLSDCDANLNKHGPMPCDPKEKDPVCAVLTGESYGGKTTVRGCYARKEFLSILKECKTSGKCKIAMCETKGCMAELPTSGIQEHFSK